MTVRWPGEAVARGPMGAAPPGVQLYRIGAGEWTEYWSPQQVHPQAVLWLQEAATRGPGPAYRPELGDNWWWGLRVNNPAYAATDPPKFLTGLAVLPEYR